MQHRSSATERPSLGMGVVAVAVGVGYGMVDTIARHVHRNGEPAYPDALILDLAAPARGAVTATAPPRVNA